MEDEAENIVRSKVVISLRRLFDKAKEQEKEREEKPAKPISYNRVAIDMDTRKATFTANMTGKSIPSIPTLVAFLEALNFNLVDFAQEYMNISDEDVEKLELPPRKEKKKN